MPPPPEPPGRPSEPSAVDPGGEEAPWPEAGRFPLLADDVVARWNRFLRPERRFFPTHVGLRLEEVRAGYARLRLPARPEVAQVAGYIHGGALSTLIDTCAVPALGTYQDEQPEMLTVSLTVNFTGVVAGEDAVGEAWVESASRSLAFVRVEVRGAHSRSLAATASLVFRTRERRPAPGLAASGGGPPERSASAGAGGGSDR